MVFNRLLLIAPTYKKTHYSRGFSLPTGLGYIAEALHNNNIKYEIIDMSLGYNFKDLKRKIKQFLPDLICISMMTYMYKYNYRFIEKIKKHFPNIKIAVGGPHLSNLRQKVLEECKAIDFGIVLEGDQTIVNLCRNNPQKVKGLIYREENKVTFTGEREFIKDLDSIHFPKYRKFDIKKYTKYINIVSSRGCPFQCIFCPVKLTMGRQFRARSPKSIIEEIKYWYEKGYTSFGFVDDNFTLIRKRVQDLCEEIKKSGMKNLNLECPNGIRADTVDYKLLKLMKEVGFKSIGIGVESGNNLILKNLKKGETIQQIEQTIKDAIDLGYDITLYFLIGSPGETLNEVKESINLALKYPVQKVAFYNIIPFPGSELYEWAEKNKIFIKKYPQYMNEEEEHWSNNPVYSTKEFPLKDRKKAYKLTREVMKEIEKRNYKKNKLLKSIMFSPPIYYLRKNKKILDFSYFIYTKIPQKQKILIKKIMHHK
jgi:radical SAM superfamily enzyme YgiQ (UPF0313 family)